jgi:hypothetical protein
MALARRKAAAAPREVAPSIGPKAATQDSRYAPSPARDQLEALAAALSTPSEPEVRRYPAPLRLAILVGAPLAMWSGLIFAANLIG